MMYINAEIYFPRFLTDLFISVFKVRMFCKLEPLVILGL